MSQISENPLLGKFIEIERDCETGVLELSNGSRHISIVFRHGLIDAASSNLEDRRLGRYLLSILDVDQLHRLLADSGKIGAPLGLCALRSKLVEEIDVVEALGNQVSDLLLLAVEGEFKIRSFLSQAPIFEISPRLSADRLLLHIARRGGGTLLVQPGHRVFLDAERDLSRYDWYPQELAVLGQLRKFPPTLDELAEETGVPARMACKILKVLSELNLIEVHEVPVVETMALVKKSRFPLELLVPKAVNPTFHEKLEVHHRPTSFASEQFKSLKVRIRELSEQSSVHLLSVTSPHEKDGKSLVCANLALAFAEDPERRVALIDCDLRRPALHQYFGVSQEPGLLSFLDTSSQLPPHCFMRRVGELYLMTSGGQSENAVEMLSMRKMADLIRYLTEEFDRVIIDCPPCQPIADAQIVNRLADATLLVVRRGKTPYSSIERSLKTLDATRLMGVVFNDVRPEPFHTYYDYGYYNGRGYGYSGGADAPPPKKKRKRTYLDSN